MQSTEVPGRVHNGNKQEMFVRYIVDKADVWVGALSNQPGSS